MCEPTLILTATTMVAQGLQAKEKGKFDNEVSKYNARNLENEATRIRNKGNQEEGKQRRATAELISKQRASAGASGVDIDSGSPLQLQEDARTLGEVDALRIRQNFRDEARVRDDASLLARAEGQAAQSRGKNALTNSIIGVGSAYLGSKVSNKWFKSDSAAVTSEG
jgi:hypothetical protein